MLENRRHFRLREYFDVTWKLADQEVSGEGMVMNISISGLFLQTYGVFRPSDNCVLSIGGVETLPFAAKKGKIMWFRRIQTPQEGFQCGIRFLTDTTDNHFQQWFEKKVSQLSEAEDAKILGNLAF